MSNCTDYDDDVPAIFKSKKFNDLRKEWNKKLGIPEEPRRLNREYIVYDNKVDMDDEVGIEKFSNEDMDKWPKGINSNFEELQHNWTFDNEMEEKIIFLYITYNLMFKHIAKELNISITRVKNVVRRVLRQMKKHLNKQSNQI